MPDRNLEHPDISKAGMTDDEKNAPHCPMCGKWCDTIYRAHGAIIMGCDNCIDEVNAWEVEACFMDLNNRE